MNRLICASLLVLLVACTKTDDNDQLTAEDTATTQVTQTSNTNAQDHGSMMSGNMEQDMKTMNDRMVQHLGAADADYDHRFIDMMIPHHEGAIAMAKDARDKAQHAELKKMAEEIIKAQEKEIEQLKKWRSDWYGGH